MWVIWKKISFLFQSILWREADGGRTRGIYKRIGSPICVRDMLKALFKVLFIINKMQVNTCKEEECIK